MKPYKLFAHLFTLLLITFTTAQARQQNLNLDLNNNNSKRKYVHGYQEDLEKILENVQFKTLQKPLEDLYENGITRPVNNQQPIPLTYFVVGPTGAGKSTFIFTLQGNTVIETPTGLGDWNSDTDDSEGDNNNNTTQNKTSVNNLNNNYGEIGDLTLTKTIKRSTPKVGDSFYGVTEGVKIYYYIDDNKGQKSINHNEGKKSIEDNKEQESMAFCDTEGFLGKRKKNNSPAQEIVGTYAPYFVLKANTIGGIVFLISEQDIRGGRGKSLFLCAEFIQNYFATGLVGKNQEELKKSILLVITKCPEKKKKQRLRELLF